MLIYRISMHTFKVIPVCSYVRAFFALLKTRCLYRYYVVFLLLSRLSNKIRFEEGSCLKSNHKVYQNLYLAETRRGGIGIEGGQICLIICMYISL